MRSINSWKFSNLFQGNITLKRLPWRQAALAFVILGIVATLIAPTPTSVNAAPILSVEPLTWNVIGLDSNDVFVGPNQFPVGARVCNNGDTPATNLVGTFVWDSANALINSRPGTDTVINVPSLANGSCYDFYYEVEITRSAAAYDTTRRYHIAFTADGNLTASTPTPRELYVEHLVSQSRNATTDVLYGPTLGSLTSVPANGTMYLVVGNEYYIRVVGYTATMGYEQLESFLNIPNKIFQTLDVVLTADQDSSAYVHSPDDRPYANGCQWENDPNSPNYRTCLDVGKLGGNIVVTYHVKILRLPPPPLLNPEPLRPLIYDFSGSSYHYNSDFSSATRYAQIIAPSLNKSFDPKTINPGQTAAMVFTINNPGSAPFSDAHFIDNLPTGLSIASTTVTYAGCGAAALPTALTVGQTNLEFTSLSISGNGTCTITVTVTGTLDGVYNNTTGNLFIGDTDTGSSGSDTLAISSKPPAPSTCSPTTTLATWAMPAGSVSPPSFSTKAADVAIAVATSNGGTFTIDAVEGNPVDSWAGSGWPTTGTITPPNPPAVYYDFTLDTSRYGGVNITFDYYMKSGDWANIGNNFIYLYSQPNAAAFDAGVGFAATKGSWQTLTLTPVPPTGTGTTTFRISAAGAKDRPVLGVLYIDNVTITGCPRPLDPTLSKSFTPSTIMQGSSTTLSFLLTNPSLSIPLTNVSFLDVVPAGLTVVAAAPGGTCNGTLTVTAPRTINLTGATLAANASCTVNVTVTGTLAGQYHNVSGAIASAETGPNTTSSGFGVADLTVIAPPVISKVFGAESIQTTGTTSLTFGISNPNTTVALTGVAFTDTLPAGLVVANPSGLANSCGGIAAATPGGSTISLSAVTLPAGGFCTVSVNVLGQTIGTKTNAVTVTSTNGGTGNTSTATVVVKDPTPQLRLLKQIGTTATGPWNTFLNVDAGIDVFYRFTVENTGDVPLANVTVTDSNFNTSGCVWISGNGSTLNPPITLPVADANNSQLMSCVLGPFTTTGGLVPNTASAGSTTGTNTTDDSTATYATPDLTLVKSVDKKIFSKVGELLTYSYLVTNSGSAPLLGPVTIADNKETVTCPPVNTVGDLDGWLDVGESITCTVVHTVTQADIDAGVITNVATASAGGVDSNQDTQTVSVSGDLTVEKTNNLTGSATPGVPFTWTLTLRNISTAGLVTFTNGQVILNDPLPAGPTYGAPAAGSFTNITNSANISCAISGAPPTQTLTCSASGGDVTIGAPGSFAVSFSVTPSANGSLQNSATADPGGVITETDENNNTGSNTVTVENPTDTPTPTATNTQTSTPTDTPTPTPTDTPTETPTPSDTPTDTPTATITDTPTETPTPTITDTPTETGTPTITPTVTDTPTITNTPTITDTPTVTPTPSPTGSPTPTEVPTTDLSFADPVITKSGSPDSAVVGDIVTYTLIVTNNGPANATDVVVVDDMPDFLDLIRYQTVPGQSVTSSVVGQKVTVTIPLVRPSDTYKITLVTRVNSKGTPPGGRNRAFLTSSSGDRTTTNNSDDFTVTILPPESGLPQTGFPADTITNLAAQPLDKAYSAYGDLWIEIPRLGINANILGVPLTSDGWDTTWLGKNAGYLEGTAFPTWKGNSAIAAHITTANGKPGPFANLSKLKFGDRIIIHAWDQQYIYEVRSNEVVSPANRAVIDHKKETWVTLITCKDYNEKLNTYEKRVVVQAVLVKITDEK